MNGAVLVTGAAGALGHAVVAELRSRDLTVVALDRPSAALDKLGADDGVHPVPVELADRTAVRAAFGEVDALATPSALIALAGGLLERSTRGGLIVVGSLNLGGSLELLPNAVALVEIAIDKQAAVLLMPVAARRQLNELPDELWTKINIEFYSEPADAFFKALAE